MGAGTTIVAGLSGATVVGGVLYYATKGFTQPFQVGVEPGLNPLGLTQKEALIEEEAEIRFVEIAHIGPAL